MSIKREDVDNDKVDFSDIASGRKRLPLLPGAILKDEFLAAHKLSVNAAACAMKISRARLNEIVRGERGITADTALRLGRFFGNSPQFWMNLQARYDLVKAESGTAKMLKSIPLASFVSQAAH